MPVTLLFRFEILITPMKPFVTSTVLSSTLRPSISSFLPYPRPWQSLIYETTKGGTEKRKTPKKHTQKTQIIKKHKKNTHTHAKKQQLDQRHRTQRTSDSQTPVLRLPTLVVFSPLGGSSQPSIQGLKAVTWVSTGRNVEILRAVYPLVFGIFIGVLILCFLLFIPCFFLFWMV